MSRPTKTGVLGALALCYGCGWEYQGKNALPLAAKHYDKCGGKVNVEITTVVIYGGSD